VIPGITVSDPSATVRTATIVNSGLQPWTADNYDVSLETYTLKGATVALSLYRKDIRNFFVQTQSAATLAQLESFGLSDDYLDYLVNTKTNGGDARIEGYEFSWRQQLYFLPAWAKGLSTYANATISHLSGANATDFNPFAHKNINWGSATCGVRSSSDTTLLTPTRLRERRSRRAPRCRRVHSAMWPRR
jgi:outer membrane receptor protein involved in Fe transport